MTTGWSFRAPSTARTSARGRCAEWPVHRALGAPRAPARRRQRSAPTRRTRAPAARNNRWDRRPAPTLPHQPGGIECGRDGRSRRRNCRWSSHPDDGPSPARRAARSPRPGRPARSCADPGYPLDPSCPSRDSPGFPIRSRPGRPSQLPARLHESRQAAGGCRACRARAPRSRPARPVCT